MRRRHSRSLDGWCLSPAPFNPQRDRITKTDVLEIIITKRHTAPQMARALLILIKRFFGWVVDQEIYGLSTSPCEGLSGKKLIGELQSRDRRLTPDRHRDIRVLAGDRADVIPGWFGLPDDGCCQLGLRCDRRASRAGDEARQVRWTLRAGASTDESYPLGVTAKKSDTGLFRP